MSRLSVVKSLKCAVFTTGQLALGYRPLVRRISDNSDSSSSDQVKNQLKLATSQVFISPDVANNLQGEVTNDIFTATWDCKNNELDVEQLAGLPSPSEADDPYASAEHEQMTSEEEYQQFQEELQFGRMIALREQLDSVLCSPESFTTDERNSLASVRKNLEFMMQELRQISLLLNTFYPQQVNAATSTFAEEDCVPGALEPYSEPQIDSWAYTHPSLNQNKVSNVEVKDEDSKEDPDQDEVMGADDSRKPKPAKPSEITPIPNKDGSQHTQRQETIHTYRPFRTIDVPAPKPSQGLNAQANAEEVVGSTGNSPMTEGYTVSTQFSESDSRFLMQMALKQALRDLEAGRTNYKATLLMATDEESHDVD